MPKDLGSNPSTATVYLLPLNQPPPHPLENRLIKLIFLNCGMW